MVAFVVKIVMAIIIDDTSWFKLLSKVKRGKLVQLLVLLRPRWTQRQKNRWEI